MERTPAEYHALFVALDAQYNTSTRSPLHHDNRGCPLCDPSPLWRTV